MMEGCGTGNCVPGFMLRAHVLCPESGTGQQEKYKSGPALKCLTISLGCADNARGRGRRKAQGRSIIIYSGKL